MRRTVCYKLSPEDRATHSKWVRVVAAFYGCAALLLLLAAISLAGRSSGADLQHLRLHGIDPVLGMQQFGAVHSRALGEAAQQLHPGRRGSDRTLKILQFAEV